MVFATAADFRILVREYAVATKKPLKFVKNEPMRVRVKCVNADCDFFVLCSQVGKSTDLSIKTMDKNHTCGTSIKIPTISVKWLAKRYVNKVRRTPTISMKAFIDNVYDDLKVEISRSTAHRAIKAAGYLMYGNETRHIMPGSTVIIKQEEQKFQRIYVCPSPLKKGFLAGCRRFVCLDGCCLKGSFRSQILAAVGLDADNGIYPVA
ncbi:hypothetical protein LIER_31375 [Lithospermum erythrorhizon]|uniref:Transposase MuDR plant domain-containing protein n=1 Tax=Lithospermum erythrorhizon TaxID=34254 RepID=A0AAV3RUS8_LITER